MIGSKPPHIMRDEERKSIIDCHSMFIDIGASSANEARGMGVEIGDPISFPAKFRRMGAKIMCGKALDNRLGCYALLMLAKGLKGNVVLLGTSQEEVSVFGKGAMTASYRMEPSLFIAVDTTVAGDHPELKPDDAPISLAKGPAIALVEAGARGNVASKRLVQKIVAIAKRAKVDLQLEVVDGGATDASSVYNLRGGIPSIAICIPTRYIHSTVGVAQRRRRRQRSEADEDAGGGALRMVRKGSSNRGRMMKKHAKKAERTRSAHEGEMGRWRSSSRRHEQVAGALRLDPALQCDRGSGRRQECGWDTGPHGREMG